MSSEYKRWFKAVIPTMRITCSPRRYAVYCMFGWRFVCLLYLLSAYSLRWWVWFLREFEVIYWRELEKSWFIHPLRVFEICCLDSSGPSLAGLCFVGTHFQSSIAVACHISCSRLAIHVFCLLLMLYIQCSRNVLSFQCVIFEICRVELLMNALCSRHE